MAPQMKGLTLFITDLRNSRDAEEESKRINLEINNIRSKFNSSLKSYQKKKYVCKLIYIYLLGYTDEAHFGLKQAFELAASNDYSEKHLGYLLISILSMRKLATQLEFFTHMLNVTHAHLIRDLKVDSEDINCLALLFITSNFNAMTSSSLAWFANEMVIPDSDPSVLLWLELIDMVYSLCVSPIAQGITRKRAVLALFVMLKLRPLVILANDNWIPRLLTLIDDNDPSVVLCAVPLVKFLTDMKPQYAKSIVPSIANRLHALVVDKVCLDEYYYYDIPAPWLVIKLLQLVEHFFLSDHHHTEPLSIAHLDNQTVSKLRQTVAKSIQNASKHIKGQSNRNSQSSILFQAVSLAIFLDASPEAIEGAMHALIQLLDSTETNTRYLVLDALIKLLARSNFTSPFKEYLDKIFLSLHDKDVSVRRKSVDLLYTVCDATTFTQIISKLLDFFPLADSSLKSDISVKVAVLAEKFATDSIWYVSTMLRLLSIGGKSSKTNVKVGGISSTGEVWERIIQIIVNNEDLQRKAGKYIINLLKKAEGVTAENLVKVAAFILGDYGYLLVEGEDQAKQFTAKAQFQILYDAYFKVSLVSRPMIMSAFVKFVVRFPTEDFIPDILDLLEAETQSLSLEIQTRAFEYLKVSSLAVSGNEKDIAFVKNVIRPLPPFEIKKSSLMNHLGSVNVIGTHASSSMINVLKIPKPRVLVNGENPDRLASPNSGLSEEEDLYEGGIDPFRDAQTAAATQLTPNWYAGYHRMLHYDAGIFYEDQLVRITYRTIKSGPSIVVQFTIINNAAKTAEANITAFTVMDIQNMQSKEVPNYIISMTQVPDLTIATKSTMELEIKVRDIVENHESPILCISFKCSGSFNNLHLKIPVVLVKTLTGTALSSLEDFKRRWIQIGELLGTEQGEARGSVQINHRYTSSNMGRMLERLGFAIVHSTPDAPNAGILVMGAGILHTVKSNYGVLVTIKSTDDVGKQFDVVVRCTGGGVPEIILETLEEIFSAKV